MGNNLKILRNVYNVYVVTAKLKPNLYSKFWKYCKKNNLNKNSAINKLLNSHPEINGKT